MPKNWSCLFFVYIALTFICFIFGAAFLRSLRISLSSILRCLSGSSISLMRSFNSLRLRSRSSAARSAKEKKKSWKKISKKKIVNFYNFEFAIKNRENVTGFISREKQFRKSRENCFKQFSFNEKTVVKKSWKCKIFTSLFTRKKWLKNRKNAAVLFWTKSREIDNFDSMKKKIVKKNK